MNVGIGLPIGDPASLLSWARRADAGPFTTLGLLDRLVYDNPEPLITLATIVGATSRIRVQTEVLLAPLHAPALLAKQSTTLDRISGGRFTLGIGVGLREDDYVVAGVDPRRRGRILDDQLAVLRHIWSGAPYTDNIGPIGPAPVRPGGPEVLFGGFTQPVIDRVARWGDGFIGALPPNQLGHLFRAVEESWRTAGRPGRPRLVAQANVALGPAKILEDAEAAIHAYYSPSEHANRAAAGMLTTPERVRAAIAAFTDLGADEVILYCWSDDCDQVDRLADAVADAVS